MPPVHSEWAGSKDRCNEAYHPPLFQVNSNEFFALGISNRNAKLIKPFRESGYARSKVLQLLQQKLSALANRNWSRRPFDLDRAKRFEAAPVPKGERLVSRHPHHQTARLDLKQVFAFLLLGATYCDAARWWQNNEAGGLCGPVAAR